MTETIQTGTGWTGLMVLRGTFDISPLLAPATKAGPDLHMLHGSLDTGDMSMHKLSAAPDEALATTVTKFQVAPYNCIMIGDCPDTVNVPARNTTVSMWSQGYSPLGLKTMIDSLITLNQTPIDKEQNYAKLLCSRVTEPHLGKFSVCLAYLSKRPRLVLATRRMGLYLWIMSYNGVQVVVWSTDKDYAQRIRASMDDPSSNSFVAHEVHMPDRSLLVVHPLYWITKYNRMISRTRSPGMRNVDPMTYFSNYLTRTLVVPENNG